MTTTAGEFELAPRRHGHLRRAAALVAALASGAVLLVGAGTPAHGEAPHRQVVDPVRTARLLAQSRWQQVAATFERAGVTPDELFVAADAASALAHEVTAAGWASPAVPGLVDALVATANPDGGYGLARAWDAYQDGTVNPASTSYAATTAGHVGPVLLAGYLAGAVPASVVDRAIDSILDLPRATGADAAPLPAPLGVCVPYSSSRFDLGKACVWNVHFGAAAWVLRASAATGHRPDDVAALVTSATSALRGLAVDPVTGYLPYSTDQSRPQDIGHQLWTARAIDELRGNRAAFSLMVTKTLWRSQAQRFRDYNVASAMSGIALFDCRYATDPLVLRYAASTARGNPYAYKALAAQAREVVTRCFRTSASAAVPGTDGAGLLPHDLG